MSTQKRSRRMAETVRIRPFKGLFSVRSAAESRLLQDAKNRARNSLPDPCFQTVISFSFSCFSDHLSSTINETLWPPTLVSAASAASAFSGPMTS